jgi:hypothetical protein
MTGWWRKQLLLIRRSQREARTLGSGSGGIDLAFSPSKVCPNAVLLDPEGKRLVFPHEPLPVEGSKSCGSESQAMRVSGRIFRVGSNNPGKRTRRAPDFFLRSFP